MASFAFLRRLSPTGLPDYSPKTSDHSVSNHRRAGRGSPGCRSIRLFAYRFMAGFVITQQTRPARPTESSSPRLPLREACVADWSFSSRCSPPHVAMTQLRLDTPRLPPQESGLPPLRLVAFSGALEVVALRQPRPRSAGGRHWVSRFGDVVAPPDAASLGPRRAESPGALMPRARAAGWMVAARPSPPTTRRCPLPPCRVRAGHRAGPAESSAVPPHR